jgi:DNA-binding GntR family transcriptional regulator
MTEFRRDVPRWVQVSDILRERITSGQIAPGDPLPSIARLQQEFGVADNTIKKALRQLREDGLVHTVPSLGTFVVDRS